MGAVENGVWVPSRAARAAGENARVRYGAPWPKAAGEQDAPGAALTVLAQEVTRVWPGVTQGGMRRPSSRVAEPSRYDPHRNGIAVDFMLRSGDGRAATGAQLADWLVEHAEELGVQYVLFSRYEWSVSRSGPRWEPYTGSDPHVDHVHAELGVDARAWSGDEMRRRLARALVGEPWKLQALLAVVFTLGAALLARA